MIVLLIISLMYVLYRSINSLHMLQQNLYNENNRYLKWINKHGNRVFNLLDLIPLIINIVIFFINSTNDQDPFLLISSLIYILCFYIERKKSKSNQNKIPLKGTNRIKRIFITSMIIYIIPMIIIYKYFKIDNYDYRILLVLFNFLIIFEYYIIYIGMLLNKPIDYIINLGYLNKANKKLKEHDDLIKIGITGSYGKTSSKNIVNNILSKKYITRVSPFNYNTKKGLMITVNNYLDNFDQVLIAEMGAYVRGEIKDICSFIKPKYGILTIIGEAHLESFKTKENICKAKFELIESLDPNGLAILNKDDPYQVNYEIKNSVQRKWISIKDKEADLYAFNIKYSDRGMDFDCLYKNTKYHFNTKLLGSHNIYNILGGILLGFELGVEYEDIKNSVFSLKPVEHRLELKKIGNIIQLDDSYNSNPVGAKSALDTLNLMDGTKVVVTPGMIELGKMEEELNYNFGKQISEVADYVLLIGKQKTKPIFKGLKDSNYDMDKVFVLNDVVTSFKVLESLKEKDIKLYALYENDLPDSYTEK